MTESATPGRCLPADYYLIPENLRHGIYVTAWFDTELWNDPDDDRRRVARSRDRGTTAAELASQAETLHDLGLDVRSAIIYVPRPVKAHATRSRQRARQASRTRLQSGQNLKP